MSIRFLGDADLNPDLLTYPPPEMSGSTWATMNRRDAEAQRNLRGIGRITLRLRAAAVWFPSSMARSGQKQSPGVFLAPQVAAIREVIDALVPIWSASSPTDWLDQIHHLPSLARHVFRDEHPV